MNQTPTPVAAGVYLPEGRLPIIPLFHHSIIPGAFPSLQLFQQKQYLGSIIIIQFRIGNRFLITGTGKDGLEFRD
jgi:hypothetical protein